MASKKVAGSLDLRGIVDVDLPGASVKKKDVRTAGSILENRWIDLGNEASPEKRVMSCDAGRSGSSMW